MFKIKNEKLIKDILKNENKKYADKLIDNKENTFRLPGGGAKPKTVEQEKQIVKFIENCNKIGITVDTSLIINELCRIYPEMLEKSRRTLRKWCYRFLKRHKYT